MPLSKATLRGYGGHEGVVKLLLLEQDDVVADSLSKDGGTLLSTATVRGLKVIFPTHHHGLNSPIYTPCVVSTLLTAYKSVHGQFSVMQSLWRT
jgi:hypothetical protein